jgi:SpoVK/Ycf46/Vps4 family AAA+-type ATPase
MLFTGPPGSGKTALAEAAAGELKMPLLTVRYEKVLETRLEGTFGNLGRLFGYARHVGGALFFDEFEVLGLSPDRAPKTGFDARLPGVVASLLDSQPADLVVLAASSCESLLDQRLTRRLGRRIRLSLPTERALSLFFQKNCQGPRPPLGLRPEELAAKLSGGSFADAWGLLLDSGGRRRHERTAPPAG